MGSPEYLSRQMTKQLMKKSEIKKKEIQFIKDKENYKFNLSVPSHGVAAITIQY